VAQVERGQEERRGKVSREKSNGGTQDGWKGFVNLELSDKEKQAVKRLFEKYGDAWGSILERVGLGYKLTVSYDDPHTTFNVSLTCRAVGDKNVGLTLTGRGGSMQAACVSLWYKDQHVLKGDWSGVGVGRAGRMEVDDVE